jgi:circadian clock protein KaiB
MTPAADTDSSLQGHGRGPANPVQHSTTFELVLYVTGGNNNSTRAIENLHRICAEHLAGLHRIEVIDLLEHPQLAREAEIFAVPTLVRRLPDPIRTIIGDLSDTAQVLATLGLPRTQARSVSAGDNLAAPTSIASAARRRADARWRRDPPSDRSTSSRPSPDET